MICSINTSHIPSCLLISHLMLTNRYSVIYVTDSYLSQVQNQFSGLIWIHLLTKLINENIVSLEKQVHQLSGEDRDALLITAIKPFLKSQLISHNYAERVYGDLPSETGLLIEFTGPFQHCGIIYHVLDKFFKKHPLTLLQLSQLQYYMFQKYCIGYPALVFEWFETRKMIKYSSENTAWLMEILSQGECIFRRCDVPALPNRNNYDTILAYKNIFKRYIRQQQVHVSRLQITQQAIYFLSDRNNAQLLWQKLNHFLTIFSIQRHQISLFQDDFEIETFMNFYAKQLKEIQVIEQAGRNGEKRTVYSINYLCDEDTAEHVIQELYFKMIKSMRVLPSLVRPPPGPKFRLLQRQAMTGANTLRQKVHLINGMFKIVVRSFGSIHQNQGIVLFLVHDLEKCSEFRQVLGENQISQGTFKDWIRGQRGERYLEYLTDRSRHFNNCIGWYINMATKNKDRIIRDLEYFFNTRYKDIMEIKIVIPVDSKELLEFVLPIFFQKLMELTRFAESGIIKTVEFIASCRQEEYIREWLLQAMYVLGRSRCIKIETFQPLELSRFSIEKMMYLSYFTVEYWPQGQPALLQTLSSLNSTVIIHEATKARTCKFIITAHLSQQQCQQYILNIQLEKVFSVGVGGLVCEQKWSCMGKRMKKVVEIVRKYCKNMDMLVLYGEDMQDVQDNLFYCDMKFGDMRGTMTKVSIDLEKDTMALNKQLLYEIRFKFHTDKPKYVVETHEEWAQEVRMLLKDVKT